MTTSDLTKMKCVPCEGGTPKLEAPAIQELLGALDGWEAGEDRLRKRFKFRDFREAMAFLNRVADLAEAEGHHPDFSLHYSAVDFEIWTHAVGGLSENDFILAAKIDREARPAIPETAV